jgi:hypothetical protein
MLTPPPLSPPVNDPAHVSRILRRHRPFMIAAGIALSGLVVEEAWAVTQFSSQPSPGTQLLITMLILLVALVGNELAFLLPLGRVHPEKFARPVGAFASATAQGLAIMIVTNAVAFFLLLSLAGFDLETAYILLKDVYVYTLVAVLFHGLLYYVRHMHWLYDKFGSADSPFKPIAASGGIGAVIFIITITFLPMDLQSVNAAGASLRGLFGLHIYGRDLYLITLALGAYAWHLRWIADH